MTSQTDRKVSFGLGQLVATPAALNSLQEAGKDFIPFLRRHVQGDWGDLPKEDVEANERALKEGTRLMSVYRIGPDLTIWIITEADRSATTILLPDDY